MSTNGRIMQPGATQLQVVHHPSNLANSVGGAFVIGNNPVLVTTGGVDIVTETTIRMAAAIVASGEVMKAPSNIAKYAREIAMDVLKLCQEGPSEGQRDATDKDLR